MGEPVLEIKGLSVEVEDGKNIINNLSLSLNKGESYVLFGPNGSGKTTLLMTVAGVPSYIIKGGKILYNGRDITKLSIDQRVRLGIVTAFQLPPEIKGVKLRDVLKVCTGKSGKDELSKEEMELVERFRLTEFLDRDINLNFSGGERKRAEILQIILMKPKLLLIDEPDSGVDIKTLEFIGNEINGYIRKNNASAVIVTHHGAILNYIKAEHACVMFNKEISCFNDPQNVVEDIKERGYEGCRRCRCPRKR